MSRLCKCGHAKSQHPNKECDYKVYVCGCGKYKEMKPTPKTEEDTKPTKGDYPGP